LLRDRGTRKVANVGGLLGVRRRVRTRFGLERKVSGEQWGEIDAEI